MTKKVFNKISVTKNIQIRRNTVNLTIELIDRTTGETAELTEATLEEIIRNNNLYDTKTFSGFRGYKANDKIILYLINDERKYVEQQEA